MRVTMKGIATKATGTDPVDAATGARATAALSRAAAEAPDGTRAAPLPAPRGAPTKDAKAGLYDAPLPARRLPPLHEALADPALPPLSPSTHLQVPDDAVSLLLDAKRVLVVGHTAPDGDSLGSSLALARALRALGKEADTYVDGALQGQLRGLDEGDTKGQDELEGSYDAVVLVDVAQASRTGGAAKWIGQAQSVLVVDHHKVDGAREEAGAREGARFSTWVKPGLEAASLQVAALVERLEAAAGRIDEGAWAEIALPLSAGTLTDTQHFRLPGASEESLRMFKHIVGRLPRDGLDEVEATLDWHLPQTAIEALASGEGEGEVHHERWSSPKADVIAAPKEALDEALEEARHVDPEVVEMDVKAVLLDKIDAAVAKNEVAVLVTESDQGVQVSVRSQDPDLALQVVEEVFPGEGGGKPHVAAARPKGDLDEVMERISSWLDARKAARDLRLRVR